jgi:hypothetical protein
MENGELLMEYRTILLSKKTLYPFLWDGGVASLGYRAITKKGRFKKKRGIEMES